MLAVLDRLTARWDQFEHAVSKVLLFGIYGAVGCAMGWLAGELFLLVARASSQSTAGGRGGAANLVFSREFAERQQREGAKTGDIQLTLIWNNVNDLDLHCVDPSGEEIYFAHRRSRSGGELDVDQNANPPYTASPVENIYWPLGSAPKGKYRVLVHFYDRHDNMQDETEFKCAVGVDGRVEQFAGRVSMANRTFEVKEFEFGTSAAPSGASLIRQALLIGFWTALLAMGLAFALMAGQNRYLKRPLLSRHQALLSLGGGLMAGLVAGVAGQLLYAIVAQSAALTQLGRLGGWTILGGLLGWGMGYFIPNLSRKRAAAAGAGGGAMGSLAFIAFALIMGDTAGRFAGAAILGFCIGLMVAWAERMFRKAWLEIRYGIEKRTVNLGPEPVSIGSNASVCTIYARDAAPIAFRYSLRQGKITREDVVTHQFAEMQSGEKHPVGTVEVTAYLSTTSEPIKAVPNVPKPPPPPPVRKPGTLPAVGVKAPPPPPRTVPASVESAKSSPSPPPPTIRPAQPVNSCPTCGRKIAGTPGKRHCAACNKTF